MLDDDIDLVVVATPAGVVATAAPDDPARHAPADVVVTDVAGVKSSIVDEVDDAAILGRAPDGRVRAARPGRRARRPVPRVHLGPHADGADTSPQTYSGLHGILREIGANVVAVSAHDHDRLVALASHVPHLVAGVADERGGQAAEQDAVLPQLAAGGFRDMTRMAAGDPAIWPDVLFENRAAVTLALASLEDRLADASSRAAG